MNKSRKKKGREEQKAIEQLVFRARILKVKIEEIEQAMLPGLGRQEARLNDLLHKIRLFFIPHRLNNYKPHALRMRRVFLYGALAVSVKAILILTILAMPFTAWLSVDFYAAQKQELAKRINAHREHEGKPPLAEDSRLTQAAFIRAQAISGAKKSDGYSSYSMEGSLKAVQYGFSAAQEAVADNFFDNEKLYYAWIENPQINGMLLDGNYREYGLEIVYDYESDTNIAVFIAAEPKSQAEKDFRQSDLTAQNSFCPAVAGASEEGFEGAGANEQEAYRPRILGLGEKTITRQSDFTLKIEAPFASQAMLYVDDRELMLAHIPASQSASKMACPDVFQADVRLEEGQHSLMVKSVFERAELYSGNYSITVDNTPPFYYPQNSNLQFFEKSGGSAVMEAEIALSTDCLKAAVLLGNYRLQLERKSANQNIWSGRLTFSQEAQETLGLLERKAVLEAEDAAGNAIIKNLEVPEKMPAQKSAIPGYLLLKRIKPDSLKLVLLPSQLILQLLLIFSVALLIINIYTEAHRQRSEVIFSAIGIVFLLAVMLII